MGTLPKTNSESPWKSAQIAPKGNDRIPTTIHFQVWPVSLRDGRWILCEVLVGCFWGITKHQVDAISSGSSLLSLIPWTWFTSKIQLISDRKLQLQTVEFSLPYYVITFYEGNSTMHPKLWITDGAMVIHFFFDMFELTCGKSPPNLASIKLRVKPI